MCLPLLGCTLFKKIPHMAVRHILILLLALQGSTMPPSNNQQDACKFPLQLARNRGQDIGQQEQRIYHIIIRTHARVGTFWSLGDISNDVITANVSQEDIDVDMMECQKLSAFIHCCLSTALSMRQRNFQTKTAKISRNLESEMKAKVTRKVQENMIWLLKN